jgi:hypothetical protein
MGDHGKTNRQGAKDAKKTLPGTAILVGALCHL